MSDVLGMFLEEGEKLAYHSAMDQWERSLKRRDLSEKDRVRGALFAFSRQLLACKLIDAALPQSIQSETDAARD